MYRLFWKRLIDLIFSAVGLLLLWPVILLVYVTLYIANKGKPLFTQVRPGLHDQLFTILKFRTMTDERDEDGDLLPDTQRLTRVGSFIRKTSLDELPQLINVLKGDMSIVGPRPLLVDYLEMYDERQKRRHQVRPGITGWAQVNGRNNLSWSDKLEFDVWYVDNCSFFLDLRIVFLTVKKVFKASDVSLEWNDTPWKGFKPKS